MDVSDEREMLKRITLHCERCSADTIPEVRQLVNDLHASCSACGEFIRVVPRRSHWYALAEAR